MQWIVFIGKNVLEFCKNVDTFLSNVSILQPLQTEKKEICACI